VRRGGAGRVKKDAALRRGLWIGTPGSGQGWVVQLIAQVKCSVGAHQVATIPLSLFERGNRIKALWCAEPQALHMPSLA
jgi:hypothetical protein